MAAPKAPSELGQSRAGLITAAVLLFVPPPQDGALLARYITSRYIPGNLYPGSTCALSSIWIDRLLFSAPEISSRLDRVTPRGRLLQPLPYTSVSNFARPRARLLLSFFWKDNEGPATWPNYSSCPKVPMAREIYTVFGETIGRETAWTDSGRGQLMYLERQVLLCCELQPGGH